MTAVRAVDLAKRYRIGPGYGVDTFREMVSRRFRRLAGFGASAADGPAKQIWALGGVSFEMEKGDVMGVIGRNGSGKSTLLKVLARVTEPTRGHAEMYGSVASLLEVGTGFHSELTGRENIFLNGAILGMRVDAIRRKFSEIVDFAETGKFIDTPVKHYSSGMYMRLAFSVAAHLEADVLLVDEVLAVGDAAFQKKCMGKLGRIAKNGRSVIFVSHNLSAVQSLCTKAILLEAGELVRSGPTGEVIHAYQKSLAATSEASLGDRTDRAGDGTARIVSLKIEDDLGGVIRSGSRLKITIGYESSGPLRNPVFAAGVYDLSETGIFLLNSDAGEDLPETMPETGSVVCRTEPIHLTAGRCYVNATLFRSGAVADYVQRAAWFDVESENVLGLKKIPTRDWFLGVLGQKWRHV